MERVHSNGFQLYWSPAEKPNLPSVRQSACGKFQQKSNPLCDMAQTRHSQFLSRADYDAKFQQLRLNFGIGAIRALL